MTKRIAQHRETQYPVREFTFSPEPGFDRALWGDGPWTGEPDKVQWVDPMSDLDCLIHRSPVTGALCGYVGVPEGHPCFAVHYSERPSCELSVHGGLTFANFCQECEPSHPHMGVCHEPYDGRPHHIWWLGFDCAHFSDFSPAFDSRMRQYEEQFPNMPKISGDAWGMRRSYRDRAYVEKQCRQLAAQLAAQARARA